VDPSGTLRHGCVEYQEEDLLAKKMPGAAASVYSGHDEIGVDEVMANTDVEFILTTNNDAEIVDPVDAESPCHSRRKGGDRRIPMK